jgi:hypothetical protein
VDWCRQRLADAANGLEKRHWVFSLLGCAHQQVVVDLAGDLTQVVDQLAPKYFRAIHESLRVFSKLSVARVLNLYDPLRLNQVELSPRVLWLARVGVTEASVKQVDKGLMDRFATLLQPGMGDMRELVRIVGRSKAIKFDLLRWASNVKLGTMRASLPNEILRNPGEWPGDVVQRAVEEVSDRLSVGSESIAAVAAVNLWFQES